MTEATLPELDSARAEEMIMALAARGAHSGAGVWRTTYSPEWVAANALLSDWGKAAGIPYRVMASGAGHDSQQMARLCPVAMIFMRSAGGRSHTPEEFSTLPDIVEGIRVSMGTLYREAWG